MDGGKAWPFFHFQLDLPEVGSESEPEKLYGSSWLIGVLLSCVCRTVSSCWSPTSLASSSVILELACANFLSAFQQWSLSAEALFSTILTLSVRLLWQSLYHSTFLSNSEDASSSIWQTMFSHAFWKAFLTSLDGISTVGAFDASTMCKAYASHMSHPSQCVMVIKWGIPWMSQVLDFSPALNSFATPCSSTLISLVSISESIFKQQLVACWFFIVHLGVLWSWFVKTPDDYYLITSCWISSVVWHMLSQHISGYVTMCDPSIHGLFVSWQVSECFGTS